MTPVTTGASDGYVPVPCRRHRLVPAAQDWSEEERPTMPSHASSGAPARLAIGVISAGRVGTALGQAWERAGHVVVATSAISDASRRRAADRLPEAQVLPPDEVAARADLLLLAVPDDTLAGLVGGLAATGVLRPGQIVVHTAGARGVGVLDPLARLGALPLALHPAMTFAGRAEDTARLASCCFGITAADEPGWAVAEALVLEVGAEAARIAEADRPTYHAALAHGANHLVTLVRDAVQALESVSTGVPAERVLAPLLSAALDNALRHGDRALTGPVARGDAEAVATHLRVLTEVDPELAAGYRALSRRTARRAAACGLITPDAARAVLEELR